MTVHFYGFTQRNGLGIYANPLIIKKSVHLEDHPDGGAGVSLSRDHFPMVALFGKLNVQENIDAAQKILQEPPAISLPDALYIHPFGYGLPTTVRSEDIAFVCLRDSFQKTSAPDNHKYTVHFMNGQAMESSKIRNGTLYPIPPRSVPADIWIKKVIRAINVLKHE